MNYLPSMNYYIAHVLLVCNLHQRASSLQVNLTTRIFTQALAYCIPMVPLQDDVYEFFRLEGSLNEYYKHQSDLFTFCCLSGKLNYEQVQADLQLPYNSIWCSRKKSEVLCPVLSQWMKNVALLLVDGPLSKNALGIWGEKPGLETIVDYLVQPTMSKATQKDKPAKPASIRCILTRNPKPVSRTRHLCRFSWMGRLFN
jgi:hypothetical protein